MNNNNNNTTLKFSKKRREKERETTAGHKRPETGLRFDREKMQIFNDALNGINCEIGLPEKIFQSLLCSLFNDLNIINEK